MRHKEQRVLVLFDVQNLYYSAKHIYNQKVNFKALLNEAVDGRKLIRAIAYVISTDIKEESNFHDALNNAGIEVKSKDLQVFYGGAKKGDWDIGIAMDAVRMAKKIDTLVLVSGDGDFKDLLSYMKSHGCRTEVIALGKTSSKLLREEAELFVDMEDKIEKFLIGPNNNKTAGSTKGAKRTSQKSTYKSAGAKKVYSKDSADKKDPVASNLDVISSKLSKKEEDKDFSMPGKVSEEESKDTDKKELKEDGAGSAEVKDTASKKIGSKKVDSGKTGAKKEETKKGGSKKPESGKQGTRNGEGKQKDSGDNPDSGSGKEDKKDSGIASRLRKLISE